MRAGGPECKSLGEEVVGDMSSGLVSLHTKGMLYYLQELAGPGRGSPFSVIKAPDVKASE